MDAGRSLCCNSTTWMPISNWRPTDRIASSSVNLARLFSERWQPQKSAIDFPLRRGFLGRAFRINGLVKIDPQHAGKERDRRRERQEQHNGPDGDFGDPPARKKPKKRGDW